MRYSFIFGWIFMVHLSLGAQSAQTKDLIYKKIDSVSLGMRVLYPPNYSAAQPLPAILLFFGGGWNSGKIDQLIPQAQYLASRGIIAVLAEYRTKSKHKTTPFESVKDARSAMRYLKFYAASLGIDSARIVAGGGSAGGHLAAATAMLNTYDEPGDPPRVSCRPMALVLYNPVIDNGPGGYGYERIGEQYPQFSPLHNIHAAAPPTVFFLGTKDDLVPVATAQRYADLMRELGRRCDLHLYPDQVHGFFNYRAEDLTNFKDTMEKTDTFLQSLGVLKGKATVDSFIFKN